MEWIAYNQISPWTLDRTDWLFAQVCALVASAAGGKKVKVKDYVPSWDGETTRKSPEEMWNYLMTIGRAHHNKGGK